MTACYAQRFDACTYVTLFPAWCWAGLGMAIAWPILSRRRWRPGLVLAALWLAFLAMFADSPLSPARALLPQPARGTNLRVISLNFAGKTGANETIKQFEPDIVLVQESPTSEALAALATDMFGSSANLARGVDASVVARGNVSHVAVPPGFRGNFVHARVEIDGTTINVISLRLVPCPIRLDFWSPDCWRFYRGNRAMRRMQLSQIARYIDTLPADEPLIVGGDFNCPPGDAVLRLLEPRLTDAFAVAGRGWGGTIIELAGWPLIRIDQIWTSDQLRATNVFVESAAPSDHHMTVADFALEIGSN